MLEVVHLTKVYKAKGGVETKALNDVSVRFPETGMVFLLGKSGSGKSTLLNVCGGLDSPTSGEVIVKGRSSKNFSQSDFDSYRNTFIGFVFQEYNILNEFTVEDNIALALELQGKPKDKKAIKQLLEDVDLGSFAKRKPNTLSGGQKQRIAIARALIKHPEIIMADEPTGALDSNTGKQVFDTLKKLSKTKLVIVVSHDRDFAEEYGDRIIELKDGKILSDVTKAEAQAQAVGANIEVIGDNTLSVKDGAALTQADYQYIYSFLSRNKNAIISSGEKEISDFKKVSHITENGGKEYFAETDEKQIPKKEYDGKKTKFIRSKLPMRHAFRIGVSGLKAKPFRLIFTILLCSVAFIMFGLFSTLMLYDKNETLYQTLDDAGVTVLHVDKRYKVTTEYDDYSYETAYHTRMTDREIEKISKVFGNETFGVVVFQSYGGGIYGGYQTQSIKIGNVSSLPGEYYKAELRYAGYLPENHAFRSKLVAGTYPAAGTAGNQQICISSYTASVLLAGKFENAANNRDLIGKIVELSPQYSGTPTPYTISGIFDSGDQTLSQKYSKYKEEVNPGTNPSEIEKQQKELSALTNELADGYHEIAFFNETEANKIAAASAAKDNSFSNSINSAYSVGFMEQQYDYIYAIPYLSETLLSQAGTTVFVSGKTSLQKDETVLSLYALRSIIDQAQNSDISDLSKKINQKAIEEGFEYYGNVYTWLSNDIETLPPEDPEYQAFIYFKSLTDEGGEYHEIALRYKTASKLSDNTFPIAEIDENERTFMDWYYLLESRSYEKDGEKIILEESRLEKIAAALLEKLGEYRLNELSVKVRVYAPDGEKLVGTAKTLKIVGLTLHESSNEFLFLSNGDYEEYKAVTESYKETSSSTVKTHTAYTEPENAKYDAVFLPYSSAHRNDLSMFSYEYGNDDSRFAIGNAEGQSLEMVNSIVEDMSKVFMWVGIVLAAFSMLLLSNFIATSISYKKKEIGILRAVGARGADVFKIFYSESFVIALICLILGIAGSIAGCNLINREIGETLNASIFVFGGTSIAILLGIAAITSAAATFLPVFGAARKKPVEAIRAL